MTVTVVLIGRSSEDAGTLMHTEGRWPCEGTADCEGCGKPEVLQTASNHQKLQDGHGTDSISESSETNLPTPGS